MLVAQNQAHTRWWEVSLAVDQPVFHYRFVLESAEGIFWYSANGPSHYDPLDASDFKILCNYQPPEWVQRTVFYQIFPDRFANGDPVNDPRAEDFSYRGHHPKTYPWDTPPEPQQPFPLVFYGGDLPGIQQRLDYLQELGVNALYLNPIFAAYSNHKYDVVAYDQVDPHFGGDAALVELQHSLHLRGIRYILDIVPNHTGYWHPWFQTARQDPSIPEARFYTFNQHPDHYISWLGVWSLPKLNYTSEELRRRIYAGDDAVFRRWLRPPFACDGWRVDVANMLARQGPQQLGAAIAREIRQAVKETRPDAYLVGENFFDATGQLQGDQWDGVMNYMGLTMPLWHWLRGYEQGAWGMQERITSPGPWPTSSLEATWRTRRAAIPWPIALQQFNLLGSHDTARIRTIVGGSEALHRLAAVIQFTYPGVPCVYYGDELGMANDPQLESRGCMDWELAQQGNPFFRFYQQLIGLRKSSLALQRGGFQMLTIEADTLAFQRETPTERVVVVAHRGDQPRQQESLAVWHGDIPDGARFREFFSGAQVVVRNGQLAIGPQLQGASIWIQVTGDE
jgi:alpha-glucosidase